MTSAHSTTAGPKGAVRLGIFVSNSHELSTDGFILYYSSSHTHEVEQTTTHVAIYNYRPATVSGAVVLILLVSYVLNTDLWHKVLSFAYSHQIRCKTSY